MEREKVGNREGERERGKVKQREWETEELWGTEIDEIEGKIERAQQEDNAEVRS